MSSFEGVSTRFAELLQDNTIEQFHEMSALLFGEMCNIITDSVKDENPAIVSDLISKIERHDPRLHELNGNLEPVDDIPVSRLKAVINRIREIITLRCREKFLQFEPAVDVQDHVDSLTGDLYSSCRFVAGSGLNSLYDGLAANSIDTSSIDTISLSRSVILDSQPASQSKLPELQRDLLFNSLLYSARRCANEQVVKVVVSLFHAVTSLIPETPVDLVALFKDYFFAGLEPSGPDTTLTTITGLIAQLGRMSEKSRREGLLSLEEDLEDLEVEPGHLFIDAITGVVDGVDPVQLRSILSLKKSNKLARLSMIGQIIVEGVLSIQTGENSRLLVAKLQALTGAGSGQDIDSLINAIAELSEKTRREGVLALDDEIDQIPDPLFQTGLYLVLNGTDPGLVHALLSLLLDVIHYYYRCYYDVCTEGALLIQNGNDIEEIETFLYSIVPFSKSGIDPLNDFAENGDLLRIFQQIEAMTDAGDFPDTASIPVISFMRSLFPIIENSIQIDTIISSFAKDSDTSVTEEAARIIEAGIYARKGSEVSETPVQSLPQRPQFDFTAIESLVASFYDDYQVLTRIEKETEKKIELISSDLSSIQSGAFESVDYHYARHNPSMTNLNLIADDSDIIPYLEKLGDIHVRFTKEYDETLTALVKKTKEEVAGITSDYFQFNPDTGSFGSRKFIMDMIRDAVFTSSGLIGSLATIFTDSEIQQEVLDAIFPMEALSLCSREQISVLLSGLDWQEIIMLIAGDSIVNSELFIEAVDPADREKLLDQLETVAGVAPEDTARISRKIRLLALEHDEVISLLKMQNDVRRMEADFYINPADGEVE
jgi:flagellar motor component MotA